MKTLPSPSTTCATGCEIASRGLAPFEFTTNYFQDVIGRPVTSEKV
jgi:hypothetical protein